MTTREEIRTNRRKWVTALRTTDKPQAKGRMVRPGSEPGYCCLGVAAIEIGIKFDWLGLPFLPEPNRRSVEPYGTVRDGLKISDKIESWFIALNDGNHFYHNYSRFPRSRRVPRRDFRFIARCAEILFTLDEIGIDPE